MYEIGLPQNANSSYKIGLIVTDDSTKKASTSTSEGGIRNCFKKMGYFDPGDFVSYNFSGVKSSIDNNKPVITIGYSEKTETTINYSFLWWVVRTETRITYDKGHSWIIDGYRRMTCKARSKTDNKLVDFTSNYVHCNLGWGTREGWYIDTVFDTNHIPLTSRSTLYTKNFYQYNLRMLTNITPDK